MSKFERLIELYAPHYDNVFLDGVVFNSGISFRESLYDTKKPSDLLTSDIKQMKQDFESLSAVVKYYGAQVFPLAHNELVQYVDLLNNKEAYFVDEMNHRRSKKYLDTSLDERNMKLFTKSLFDIRKILHSVLPTQRSKGQRTFDSQVYELSQLGGVMRPMQEEFVADQEIVSAGMYTSILCQQSSLIVTRDNDIRRLTKVASRSFSRDSHCKRALQENPVSVLCLPHDDMHRYSYKVTDDGGYHKVFTDDANFIRITSSDLVTSSSRYERIGNIFEIHPRDVSDAHYELTGLSKN
jgi:hypothetical protein